MKKLFLFALPLLLISCKGVDQYRAGIEELSGNWEAATKAVTDFSGMVSNDLTNYTQGLAAMKVDEATTKKMKPEQTAAFESAKKGVLDALAAYGPFQQTINDFVSNWTTKAADVQALKDGLAAGKIEGDVSGKLTELGGMVTSANDNLKTWQESYAGIKGSVDSAMTTLNNVLGSLAGK